MLTAEFRDHEKHEALDPYQLTLDPSGPMPPPKRSTVPEPEEPEAPRLPVPTQTPLLHRGTDGKQRNRRLPEETMRSDESDKDCRETDEADAAASVSLHKNGMADGDEHVVSAGGEVCNKSFSPQVVWFQTCDSVIVTVKLMNPEVQQCDFYTDRVVYSGRVNGRSYRADLELHQNIAADACHWEMKSNQPILKLVKQEPGYWERLVRGKNIFVSFDMDHVDEKEDESSGGLRFVESPEAGSCYLSSDSDSD
ncbi:PREDICTED: uncharacterized protein LOC107099721 [Cyprinodon variegatus]|uniref:uncharacterized protein LOC107099721 n=1 Tax=Cyprinodon variegatus TaxID=28743 RepID=UPI000742608E|nr:PREDICTED: uncharacterized protein LOC107099721 [Cyprinodon variegatus]